jgi:glycosyltransferase involved in cell wall biosynthesis
MTKLVYIVTVPMTAKAFMRGHLKYMVDKGYDVTLISSPEPELLEIAQQESISTIGIKIEREISVWADLVSIWQLYWTLVKLKPDIVNASTPKAGLLGIIAAWLARVPTRIYFLRGLRLETANGFKKFILLTTEKIASACATSIVPVSQSLRNTYIEQKLAPTEKLVMVGGGSSNGVDPKVFLPSDDTISNAQRIKQELKILESAQVVGFVGRLTKDKGIVELVEAFREAQETVSNIHLLLIGWLEDGDPVPSNIIKEIESNPAIISVGFIKNTSSYYPVFDILAFPSYREGFPNVPLEAALSSIPTIGFNATGTIDAVQDGITGVIVPLGNTDRLAQALIMLLTDTKKCKEFGKAAKDRALLYYQPKEIWENWGAFYEKIIRQE